MPKFVDLTGHRFGRLVVTGRAPDGRRPEGWPRVRWHCRCDCGRSTIACRSNLRSGNSQSCGCLKIEMARARVKHGHARKGATQRVYWIWEQMRRRCMNPRHKDWPYYGGRGIYVCERWRDYENFLADMGPKPTPLHTLDRVDNDGPYSPDNCRWATRLEQSRNTPQHKYAAKAEALGINKQLVAARLVAGWSLDDALHRPLRGQRQLRLPFFVGR